MQLAPRRPCHCNWLLSCNVCGDRPRNPADFKGVHSAVCGERSRRLSVGDVEQASWNASNALDDLRNTTRGVTVCSLSVNRMLHVCLCQLSLWLTLWNKAEWMFYNHGRDYILCQDARQPDCECRGRLTSSGVFVMLPSAARMASFLVGGVRGVGVVDLICGCQDYLLVPGRNSSGLAGPP